MEEMAVRRSGKRGTVSEKGVVPVAFLTPCERAWADFREQIENPEVERIMAAIGGWDAWEGVEMSYLCFAGAFNGEPEHALRLREQATAKAATP